MADEDYPLWGVIRAQSGDMTATAGLRAYRDAGGAVRTQTWYRLWGEARAASANRVAEAQRFVGAAPGESEMTTMTVRSGRGVLQQIDVYVRDRVTGEIAVKPWSVVADEPMRRTDAIAAALDAFEEAADEPQYDEQVLGGVHVGAYRMVPER